jgi:hypothetical protein
MGSSLSLSGNSIVNNLGLTAPVGTTLSVGGTWSNPSGQTITVIGATLNLGNGTNSGIITATNSKINLGGNFTQADLGTFSNVSGSVNIIGTLTGGLSLNPTTGSWNLAGGGFIVGGTVTATGGTALTATGGTLNGVTLGANLTVNTAGVTVLNGLTLNNANVTLANATGYSNYTTFVFQGTQTLGGTGQIIFGGGNQISGIAAVGGNTIATAATLTIGPNITVDVNPLSNEGGDIYGNYSQDSIVNQGTINANTPGGDHHVELRSHQLICHWNH